MSLITDAEVWIPDISAPSYPPPAQVQEPVRNRPPMGVRLRRRLALDCSTVWARPYRAPPRFLV